MSYGTYILFGILTYLGAAFVWFYVPETKRLTLEEMDVIFGSPGTAQADNERMEEINKEIGLDRILAASNGEGVVGAGSGDEKAEREAQNEVVEKRE